jgi:drug/metabolite transporter (DMT)-like permease
LNKTPPSVHLLLFGSVICFASLPVVGRLALGHISPGAIPLVRTVGGALVFSLIAWRRGTLRISRAEIPFMVLCALLGNVLNQELFIHGLARTTAINAVVIGSTIPVFTALVAIALGREPIRARRLLGTAIAFAGVAALVGAEDLSTSSDHLFGSALILLNALSYGIYLVIARPLAERHDPFALLAFMFLAGVPMVVPFGIDALGSDAQVLVGRDYAFLAFLVAVPTVAAYGLIQTALRRAESSLVAAYVFLQPVFTALGAAIVLGEELALRTLGGAAIVLLGVWLASRTRP